MTGKTVLITGCSSGFGMLAAVSLAKNGWGVFATMRDVAKRGRLDAALATAGVTAEVLALDVTSQASIDACVAQVMTGAGKIDALVNNAGIGIGGFVEDLTLDDVRRQFETNFFGVVAVTKAVLPHLRAARSGRIVNISSIGGRTANAILSAYNASKYAVEGFSESLSFETRLFGVDVVLIEPGTFKTEIFEANRQVAPGARNSQSPYFEATRALEAQIDKLYARAAGDPQKVADAIVHALTVAKPEMRYLVGADAQITARLHAMSFRAYRALINYLFGYKAVAAKLRG
jgi:NAD(P)-dependent dehydrogenase (short-subunit alcohol dehydrogenase family)